LAPLGSPPPVAVAEPAPAAEPSFAAPTGPQPDLATLVPAAAPGRNPNVPFDVAAAAITSGTTSWTARQPSSAAPSDVRQPTQPFTAPGPPLTGYLPVQPTVQPNAQVNPAPFPAANTPQWFAPPPQSRVPAAPPPVTIGQIWQAATPGVMISLILGALILMLSALMLPLSFALSARIAYRRSAIRRTYGVSLGILGLVGVVSLFSNDFSSDALFADLSTWAQAFCIVLPLVIGLIVGSALRAGERPDRTL
jgi:hypothetical protein